jgi:hypothetical protein
MFVDFLISHMPWLKLLRAISSHLLMKLSHLKPKPFGWLGTANLWLSFNGAWLHTMP